MSKNIKSLDDLRDASDDEDEPGKTNDYYAGGEKSGQLIRGAPKEAESDEDDDKVASLFNRARKAGAVQGTSADMPSTSGAFQGTGRTLASGDGPAGQQARGAGQAEGPRTHVITFYRNGVFTVDDGPARRVEDPANFRFIDSIAKGECPDELEPSTPGAPVTVNLVRKDEDYAEPEKPKYQAFQGAGRTLGASTSAAPAAASASTSAAAEAEESEWPGADDKKPTTSLQLRMADGSRMVAKFNTTDKVSDIRRFIRAARRDLAQAQYQLMTAFPSQLIADESKTLEEAGLLNAVIIQKM